MNKGCRIYLIIGIVVFISLIIGGYFFLLTLGKAFGTDCDEKKEWTFHEYQIKEYRCLGWAGPPYYPMDIYENGRKVASKVIRNDSCVVNFRKQKDLYIKLDFCENTVSEVIADKKLLKIKDVDSVYMYLNGNDRAKKLNRLQTEKIVMGWNTSEVFDYRDEPFDSVFYPDYKYKILVFHNGSVSEFHTINYLMADSSKWTYIVSPAKDKEYFDKIWNGQR